MERITLKKIPIEEFISLLQKDGIRADQEEAEQILQFLYYYARLIVNEYFDDYLPQG
ncbi:hypothetical protein LWM68_20275 [Niabella sp. W65]|nr:hypothetical protein [Niabella sp. W65]MCH7364893.1 hypothetical protein [Niabella sp. W65]ULT40727.1 hypothetical protein KRR40_39200 [Niabella sp. I65]